MRIVLQLYLIAALVVTAGIGLGALARALDGLPVYSMARSTQP